MSCTLFRMRLWPVAGLGIAGVLAAALISSLTLNYVSFQQPQQTAAPGPMSILISDFANQTQESLFTGTLEEALHIGVEGASFISSYPRQSALAIARDLNPGVSSLDAEQARLVAVRESIDLVLSDGPRVLEAIVADAPNTRFLSCAGHAHDELLLTRIRQALDSTDIPAGRLSPVPLCERARGRNAPQPGGDCARGRSSSDAEAH